MRSRWRSLIREVHRRSLWQVLAIYVAAAWVVYGFIQDFVDIVGLPAWITPFALVLAFLGLPVVLATAFVQEGGQGRPAAAATTPPPAPERPPRIPGGWKGNRLVARFLTWDRTLRGGVLASLMFVLVVTSQLGMRLTGVGPGATLMGRGVLAERDTILLADFTASGADASLGAAVREAIRVDFEQAGSVALLSPVAIAEGLQRMRLDERTRLDETTARALAVRAGVPVVVLGEVAQVGQRYVLNARAVDPRTGTALAAFRRTARSPDALVPAIDRLSRALRAKIGESLGSLARSAPLAQVTTSSLAALQAYTRGVAAVHVDDLEKGIALLEEAVVLDPEFATAWRSLAAALTNVNASPSRIREAATRAYEHRERLTWYERQRAVALYHTDVTGDLAQVVTAYRTVLDQRPNDWAVLNNLGFTYFRQGELALARETFRRSLEASDSSRAVAFLNLMRALVNGGDVTAAAALHARFAAHHPADPSIYYSRLWIDVNRGDFDALVTRMLEYRDRFAAHPLHRASAHEHLRRTESIRGRLAEAERHGQEEARGYAEWGIPTADLDGALELAFMDLWVRLDPARALARIDGALAVAPLASLDPLDRPYARLA